MKQGIWSKATNLKKPWNLFLTNQILHDEIKKTKWNMKKDKKNITNINQNNDQARLGQPSKPINKVTKRDNITKKKKEWRKSQSLHRWNYKNILKTSLN